MNIKKIVILREYKRITLTMFNVFIAILFYYFVCSRDSQ
jgi:hypothetical protein